MIAAVPENLGNLDLVGAADSRLCRHQSLVMLAILELPFAASGGVRLRQQQRDFIRADFFRIRRRFFDQGRRCVAVLGRRLNNLLRRGLCNVIARRIGHGIGA